MAQPRKYLTKSIFKVALECPRKLYYVNKSEEYCNNNEEDPFLQALARGGYQVGALAKLRYPNGIEIKSKNHEQALLETQEHLKKEKCVLFEAAFKFENLFIRADIVVKAGNTIRLVEVKSTSFDEIGVDEEFLSPRDSKPGNPKIYSGWVEYLYDLAFQTYVIEKSYPDLLLSSFLMGVDKSKSATESGLHQLFLIKQVGRSKDVILTRDPGPNFKDHELLDERDVTHIVKDIVAGQEITKFHVMGNVHDRAKLFSDIYLKNQKFPIAGLPHTQCKACEFRGNKDGLKSGFDECWVEFANIEAASSKVMSFDLWNYRGVDKALKDKTFLLEDLTDEHLGDGVLADTHEIIIKTHKGEMTDSLHSLEKLVEHMDNWKPPFHFIDFETCMPALPFLKGFPPYSETAFQFSHHIMKKDGSILHAGQFIDLTPGKFPTFDFVRELKKQLEGDQGTIFRYSNHENSVLNRAIRLLEMSEESDKNDLIEFLKTITEKKKGKAKKDGFLWQGERKMIDLLETVKACYYSPRMDNSFSLKYVLPSVLQESKYLQKKYSKPIYGSDAMPSLNFKERVWVKFVDGIYTSDPYEELEPIFSSDEMDRIERLLDEEAQIKNGGAAMMAYCKSQFSEMSDEERNKIGSALLKYCELDTLAMVMVVEFFKSKLIPE